MSLGQQRAKFLKQCLRQMLPCITRVGGWKAKWYLLAPRFSVEVEQTHVGLLTNLSTRAFLSFYMGSD